MRHLLGGNKGEFLTKHDIQTGTCGVCEDMLMVFKVFFYFCFLPVLPYFMVFMTEVQTFVYWLILSSFLFFLLKNHASLFSVSG